MNKKRNANKNYMSIAVSVVCERRFASQTSNGSTEQRPQIGNCKKFRTLGFIKNFKNGQLLIEQHT